MPAEISTCVAGRNLRVPAPGNAWGPGSQAALDAYAAREFGGPALDVHAAAVVIGFLDAVGRDAWEVGFRAELGVSLALPLAVLGAPEDEEGGVRRRRRGARAGGGAALRRLCFRGHR